jgi:hypothetical protein
MAAIGATECVLTILVVLFVCNFVARIVRRPTFPAEPETDDYAGVPARLRPRPKSGAGAIALEEPDEGETDPSTETFR